ATCAIVKSGDSKPTPKCSQWFLTRAFPKRRSDSGFQTRSAPLSNSEAPVYPGDADSSLRALAGRPARASPFSATEQAVSTVESAETRRQLPVRRERRAV